ncbi:MAG: hypothetical protein Crog4KO_31520 [Crocinitomicaceae bacterium]
MLKSSGNCGEVAAVALHEMPIFVSLIISGMRCLLFFIFLAAIGCTDTQDSTVTGGEFTVHFSDPNDHDLAKEIVTFWKEDSLMTGNPQDVRLKRTNAGYDLMLVSVKHERMEDLGFEEISALTELEKRLQRKVFKEKELTLVIGNENFETLFRPSI